MYWSFCPWVTIRSFGPINCWNTSEENPGFDNDCYCSIYLDRLNTCFSLIYQSKTLYIYLVLILLQIHYKSKNKFSQVGITLFQMLTYMLSLIAQYCRHLNQKNTSLYELFPLDLSILTLMSDCIVNSNTVVLFFFIRCAKYKIVIFKLFCCQ